MAVEAAMYIIKNKEKTKVKTRNVKLPPSIEQVITVLEKEGPLSSSEIIKKVNFSTRTVRYALKHLLDYEIVEKQPNLLDMRRTYYKLSKKLEEVKSQVLNSPIKMQ